MSVTAEILDPNGKSEWKGSNNLAGGEANAKLSGQIHDPLLWSPAFPNLYELRVSLSSGDSFRCRFGFRSFAAHDGQILFERQTDLSARGAGSGFLPRHPLHAALN